ncbi:MAG: PBP1A family penicillin-binding protein [Alphaproteobacteria bacterium]|nr:PBP1A family penicillin-binding protein [Alphaproteobacteria bacterium]
MTHKKKTKKTGTKKKKQTKSKGFSLFRFLFKAALILGIWAMLLGGGIALWYAAELPALTADLRFERRAPLTFEAADGSFLLRTGDFKGETVSVNDLPPHLVYAVLAIEDRRFYRHHGIDPAGLARAMLRNLLKGRMAQGGSTITQQLAKNLFLSPDRTLKRKIQEALLALWLERNLTKDEILSAYLNRVYLGAGTYGVEAAAQTYFGKSARALGLYESAMLAGLLKAPSRYNPRANPARAKARTEIVLSAMRDAGYLSPDQAVLPSGADSPQPLSLPLPGRRETGENVRYFTDWAAAEMNDILGTTERGAYIRTTLDPTLQKTAERALEAVLASQSESRHVSQGALVLLDADGAVLAMVGGRSYAQSQFNRATQARRPPGSAFKPFVYAAALMQGETPQDTIADAPMTEGDYRPANFDDKYEGTVTLETALADSLNTATVRLAARVGIGKIIALARKAGIAAPLNRDLSLALGSNGVPLLALTASYGVFGPDGAPLTPYAIRSITDADGTLLYDRAPLGRGKRVLPPATGRDMTMMLTRVVTTGTGKQAAIPGLPVAGKTGTSQDYRDAWFIGYTDRFFCGVWLGNDDNSPMNGVTGGSLPAEIWRTALQEAHRAPPSRPPPPASKPETGFGALLNRLLGP